MEKLAAIIKHGETLRVTCKTCRVSNKILYKFRVDSLRMNVSNDRVSPHSALQAAVDVWRNPKRLLEARRLEICTLTCMNPTGIAIRQSWRQYFVHFLGNVAVIYHCIKFYRDQPS